VRQGSAILAKNLLIYLFVAVLPGEDFTLDVHSVIFGKSSQQERTSYYGNLRNFYFNGERLFDHMRSEPLVPEPTTPDPNRYKWRECNGYSWVMYDLALMPESYLRRSNHEVFELVFTTAHPDGLLWFTGDERNNMHLTMKVGSFCLSTVVSGLQSICSPIIA